MIFLCCNKIHEGFPHSSVGKESTCNAGDSSSIPGLGRSPREGRCHPLHYSWASLAAQLVKNPPAMRETRVGSLSWEDPWRRERLSTPVFWPGEFRGLVHGSQRVGHDWATFTFAVWFKGGLWKWGLDKDWIRILLWFCRIVRTGLPRWHEWHKTYLPMQET